MPAPPEPSTTFLTEQEDHDWAYCYECKTEFPKRCKGCDKELPYGPDVHMEATKAVAAKLQEISRDIEEERNDMDKMVQIVHKRLEVSNPLCTDLWLRILPPTPPICGGLHPRRETGDSCAGRAH